MYSEVITLAAEWRMGCRRPREMVKRLTRLRGQSTQAKAGLRLGWQKWKSEGERGLVIAMTAFADRSDGENGETQEDSGHSKSRGLNTPVRQCCLGGKSLASAGRLPGSHSQLPCFT